MAPEPRAPVVFAVDVSLPFIPVKLTGLVEVAVSAHINCKVGVNADVVRAGQDFLIAVIV